MSSEPPEVIHFDARLVDVHLGKGLAQVVFQTRLDQAARRLLEHVGAEVTLGLIIESEVASGAGQESGA
jgi:hypothetical protein